MAIYAGEQGKHIFLTFFLHIYVLTVTIANIDGKTTYFLDRAPRSTGSVSSFEEAPEAIRPYPTSSNEYNPGFNNNYNSMNGTSNLNSNARRPMGHAVNIQQNTYTVESPGGYSGPPTQRRPDPADLPDLPKYLAAKADLSAVMRDFTDNKIHFVGVDNHVIAMAEYQNISKFTKSGEDPAKFMKGEYKIFKTGYVKKTNSYTENKLFFPVFHPYAPQHISGMI